MCELDVPNYLGTGAIVYGHVHLCCFELHRIQIKSAKHKPSSTCFPISMSPRIRTIELMFIFLHIQKFICEYFFLHTAIRTYILFHNLFLSFFVFMLYYNLLCHYLLLSHYYYFIVITDAGVGIMTSHMLSIHILQHWATSPTISHPLTVMSIHVSWHKKPFSHGGILICTLSAPSPTMWYCLWLYTLFICSQMYL